MVYFWSGIAVGVLIAVPFVWFASRRTERRVRRLEGRARAAERLAELGTLTGGLAHEIKNPLSTIGLNLQLLQEDVAETARNTPPDSPAAESFARVHRRLGALDREIQRLRGTLEDFLRFAGRMKLDLSPTDINALIDELVDFYAPQANSVGIQLRTQLDAQPSHVMLDPSLFKQALLNLLLNATHAMSDARKSGKPHGGATELLVRTRRDEAEVVVNVIDTGPGVSPEVLAKIFQPYFSTRRGGTGLGLPTTRRIIEEHKGVINCHSEQGRGTEFTITLPAAPHDDPEAATSTISQPQPP